MNLVHSFIFIFYIYIVQSGKKKKTIILGRWSYTEWGPAAAVTTVQWWWPTAAECHVARSDWQWCRGRRRPELQWWFWWSSWSRSWWSNCADSWWNSTEYRSRWTWTGDTKQSRRDFIVWKESTVFVLKVHLKWILFNSQSEAEDEAVLPDDTSPTQLQNWVVTWTTVFSVNWVHLWKQTRGSEEPWAFRMNPSLHLGYY